MMQTHTALASAVALTPTLSTPVAVEQDHENWGNNMEQRASKSPPAPVDSAPANSAPANRLLAALPAADYNRLSPHLQPVRLRAGQVLHTPNTSAEGVYFLCGGLVSAVLASGQGLGAEIVAIGHEGMVGNVACLTNAAGSNGATHPSRPAGPFRYASVHIGGYGWWLPMHVLQAECERGGALHDLILRYSEILRSEARQITQCKHSHETVARLSHWLLLLRERTRTDELTLTQETLAGRLDVSSNEATLASGLLWSEKLIRFNQNHITILDHERLREKACDCSEIIHYQYERLLQNISSPAAPDRIAES